MPIVPTVSADLPCIPKEVAHSVVEQKITRGFFKVPGCVRMKSSASTYKAVAASRFVVSSTDTPISMRVMPARLGARTRIGLTAKQLIAGTTTTNKKASQPIEGGFKNFSNTVFLI